MVVGQMLEGGLDRSPPGMPIGLILRIRAVCIGMPAQLGRRESDSGIEIDGTTIGLIRDPAENSSRLVDHGAFDTLRDVGGKFPLMCIGTSIAQGLEQTPIACGDQIVVPLWVETETDFDAAGEVADAMSKTFDEFIELDSFELAIGGIGLDGRLHRAGSLKQCRCV